MTKKTMKKRQKANEKPKELIALAAANDPQAMRDYVNKHPGAAKTKLVQKSAQSEAIETASVSVDLRSQIAVPASAIKPKVHKI